MIIRELNKSDISAVKNIYELYWTGDFKDNLIKRLNGNIENSPDVIQQSFKYFVAENHGEVVGVVGYRNVPQHMIEFTSSDHPAELYIIAVKNKGEGLGKTLIEKVKDGLKEFKYTEVVLYSGETHKESWGFYDHLGFERVKESVAPNGEKGQIWRMILEK
ncbi:GNAT family N-acetyltransferase [Candidatus Gracilibacteria bacterium]|nr:GNAT family N-acetyltransferase [Candidatus Gracilibacteria bacterium]